MYLRSTKAAWPVAVLAVPHLFIFADELKVTGQSLFSLFCKCDLFIFREKDRTDLLVERACAKSRTACFPCSVGAGQRRVRGKGHNKNGVRCHPVGWINSIL
jgi:hypothetical protein